MSILLEIAFIFFNMVYWNAATTFVTKFSFSVDVVVKNVPANARDTRDAGSIPGLGRSLGGGNSNLLWYFAWKIPLTEETGRLQYMESQRIIHGCTTECTHSTEQFSK